MSVAISPERSESVVAMNAQHQKTAIYPGVILHRDFVPAKLLELQETSYRLALVAIRGAATRKLRAEMAEYFATSAELGRMVASLMPTDEELKSAYDFDAVASELNQPPYRLRFTPESVIVLRAPYCSFGPRSTLALASADLSTKAPGSLPAYAVPASWLLQWSRPLYHAPSMNSMALPTVAWNRNSRNYVPA